MTTYRYVDTPDLLEGVVSRLGAHALLGVDTEAAGYHRYLDKVSLVQLSSREETVLIDPLALPDLHPLDAIFANDAIEKVFHDADFDLRILDSTGSNLWTRLEDVPVEDILTSRNVPAHDSIAFADTWDQRGNDGRPAPPEDPKIQALTCVVGRE